MATTAKLLIKGGTSYNLREINLVAPTTAPNSIVILRIENAPNGGFSYSFLSPESEIITGTCNQTKKVQVDLTWETSSDLDLIIV